MRDAKLKMLQANGFWKILLYKKQALIYFNSYNVLIWLYEYIGH